jgi:hypothetical protein
VLLRGLVVGVRGAAGLARLHAGLQLGQQVVDVVGLVEFGGLLLGRERLSAFEFGLHQFVQLLLVVVAWCTWVNQPPEDEHITADWLPPPPAATADRDKSPF